MAATWVPSERSFNPLVVESRSATLAERTGCNWWIDPFNPLVVESRSATEGHPGVVREHQALSILSSSSQGVQPFAIRWLSASICALSILSSSSQGVQRPADAPTEAPHVPFNPLVVESRSATLVEAFSGLLTGDSFNPLVVESRSATGDRYEHTSSHGNFQSSRRRVKECNRPRRAGAPRVATGFCVRPVIVDHLLHVKIGFLHENPGDFNIPL